MSNSLPYYILMAISLCALTALLLHLRAWQPLLLLFAYSGMIYVFELVIFVWLDSYRYMPHIFSTPYYDNVMGAIVSNLFSVPVAATFVAVYRLSWRWIVCLTLLYGGIERLFLRLGIYELHWWNTAFTMLSLLVFFGLARQWPVWLIRSRKVKFLTLWMFAWSVVGTLVYLFGLSGIRMFQPGLFQDRYHDDINFSAMYGLWKALVLCLGITFIGGRRWKKGTILLILFAANFALLRLGVLLVFVPLWLYGSLHIPCYITVFWIVSAASNKLDRFNP